MKPLHCRHWTTLVRHKVAILFEKNTEQNAEVYSEPSKTSKM